MLLATSVNNALTALFPVALVVSSAYFATVLLTPLLIVTVSVCLTGFWVSSLPKP